MSIGDRIKNRRKAIGLSVDQLADKIGKNRATVYRYESKDIEKFPIDILEPLAEALATTPAYLMGWVDDPSVVVPSGSLSADNFDKPVLSVPAKNLHLSPEEEELILKFRCLDNRGRSAVLNVLDHEFASLPGEKDHPAAKEA